MSSDFITWVGTILTAIGTAVTLWQAKKVKRYKDQVAFDIRKISISEAGELLRRGQEECRKLLKSGGRGQSITNICDSVQERLDQAMNRFNQKSQDQDIKEKLSLANTLLHEIRLGNNTSQNSSALHVSIREAIQLCNERLMEIN